MTKPVFKTPVRCELHGKGHALIANDCELILTTIDSSTEEMNEIVRLINLGASAQAAAPDWEALGDKRMSELTDVQREDSREMWLRNQWQWFGTDRYQAGDQIKFLLDRLDVARTKDGPWKAAVTDACTLCEIGWDENDPSKTLQKLLEWEVHVALDPQVSAGAKDLIQQGKRTTYSEDFEENWERFWKEIVLKEDGTLNLDQVMRELSDYSMLLDYVPKVYMHVTGGKLSYPTYPSDTVISVADQHLNEVCEQAIKDEIEDREIAANVDLQQVKEYVMGITPSYQNQFAAKEAALKLLDSLLAGSQPIGDCHDEG
jgi:hypothetical protein